MSHRVKLGFVLILLGLIGVFPPCKVLRSPHVAVTRSFLFASFIPDLSFYGKSRSYHPGSMEATQAA